jgi:hypothetical protein
VTFAQLAVLGANAVSYSDSSANIHNSYVYQVAAVNDAGSSLYASATWTAR